ncbi:urate oxidase [Micromonospora sp. ANENR4]|uniref:factor-independent urate hydroxylase n=1 Tax=unclassified Micromonospora TaxID=2617518 RepID=UPI00188E5CD6|nr:MULTISPECIES: urate oxidase [unclassified Micromonospora]MBF5033681.1 urate oxidase [Micromonospora sp. ANENR4]MCZ7476241.1 urate oxidase [Micromonospora sp. WMMC273]
MAILTQNRYGKAEIRLVAVDRSDDQHRLTDLTVHVALSGAFEAAYRSGENTTLLPTDSQKNAVYALAAERGPEPVEEFGLALGRHFLEGNPEVECAQIHLVQHAWNRLGERHSFAAADSARRTATISATRSGASVCSGIDGLMLLNTTGSEFRGFRRDRYTTLPEASDRILASRVRARWVRRSLGEVDWDDEYTTARASMTAAFVDTYSTSLQQTLLVMGERVLADRPDIARIHLALSNVHHLPALSLYGLHGVVEEKAQRVYVASAQPHGVIEGTMTRNDTDGLAADDPAWTAAEGWPW